MRRLSSAATAGGHDAMRADQSVLQGSFVVPVRVARASATTGATLRVDGGIIDSL